MRNRLLIFFVAMVVVMGVIAGCGITKEASKEEKIAEQSTKEGSQKVTLRMTYWNSKDTVDALLAYIEEAVPEVKIEYQYIDNSNYNTVVDAQLSAGEGADIICESPASAHKHARLGYLQELNELGGRYSAAGTSVYTYDGNIYALPGISWFEGVYFNKDLFKQYNIEVPATFDEYIAVCKRFQEAGIKPLAAGLMSWEPMLKNSLAFLSAEYFSTPEGRMFNGDYREGKVVMSGTVNSYLEKWSEMITEGIYTTEMLGIDHSQALDEFATGKAAMFCSGPWDYNAIMEKNPSLNIDMMPFFGTTPSEGWLIGGPGCGFAVNALSDNVELAMKVLDALTTVEGQIALWENNQGGSSYLNGADFELPDVYDSASLALNAGNVYCPWNEWGEAAAAHEAYGMEFQAYLEGQDLETTLRNIDAAVEDLLSK